MVVSPKVPKSEKTKAKPTKGKYSGSKGVPKDGKCFMRFNATGQPYRVCKSGKELKFEKERAKKNKKKALDRKKEIEKRRALEYKALEKKRDAKKKLREEKEQKEKDKKKSKK